MGGEVVAQTTERKLILLRKEKAPFQAPVGFTAGALILVAYLGTASGAQRGCLIGAQFSRKTTILPKKAGGYVPQKQ